MVMKFFFFKLKVSCVHHEAITELKVLLHIHITLVFNGVRSITSKFLIIAMIVIVL